jgi:hypothetical protein
MFMKYNKVKQSYFAKKKTLLPCNFANFFLNFLTLIAKESDILLFEKHHSPQEHKSRSSHLFGPSNLTLWAECQSELALVGPTP